MLKGYYKTKPITLFVLLLFILSSPIFSQETYINKGKFNIGFEGGIQFTGVNDTYMHVSEGGIGYNFGPLIEYYLNDFVKIKAGLQYDSREFTLKDLLPIVDSSGYMGASSYYSSVENYKVNYLTIPLSITYIKGTDNFKFYVQGTFYYSILINSVQTGETFVYISESDAEHYNFVNYPEFNTPGYHYLNQAEQKFNSSDIGINLFVGGIYYIKPNLGISLSPGFSYAFSNVWEDPLRTATWSQLYKVTIGVVYSIK